MSNTIISIDITHNPELARIAEEVIVTNAPRALVRDNATLAVISPVTTAKKSWTKGSTGYAASLAAIGSQDLEANVLLPSLYTARDQGIRPLSRI